MIYWNENFTKEDGDNVGPLVRCDVFLLQLSTFFPSLTYIISFPPFQWKMPPVMVNVNTFCQLRILLSFWYFLWSFQMLWRLWRRRRLISDDWEELVLLVQIQFPPSDKSTFLHHPQIHKSWYMWENLQKKFSSADIWNASPHLLWTFFLSLISLQTNGLWLWIQQSSFLSLRQLGVGQRLRNGSDKGEHLG